MKLISSVNIPNSWEELAKLKSILPVCTPEVARLPDNLRFYHLYTKLVPKEIRMEILKNLIGDHDICLLLNDFPYSRLLQNLPEVKQYCLWSQKGKLSPEIIDQEIKKIFPNNDFFWFENSEAIKSIPEVWHCHVFVKLK